MGGGRAEPWVWKRGGGRGSIRVSLCIGLEQAVASDEWSSFWTVREEVSDNTRSLSLCPLPGLCTLPPPGAHSVLASPHSLCTRPGRQETLGFILLNFFCVIKTKMLVWRN